MPRENLMYAGIGVLITNPNHPGDVLVVKEKRADAALAKLPDQLSIVVGHCEQGVDIIETLIQEAREEAGLVLGREKLTVFGIYQLEKAMGVVLRAEIIAEPNWDLILEDEIAAVEWMNAYELVNGKQALRPPTSEVLIDHIRGNGNVYPLEIIRQMVRN